MSIPRSEVSASRIRVLLSVAVAAGLTVSLLSGSPAVAAPGDRGDRPAVQKTRSADVSKVGGTNKRVDDDTRDTAATRARSKAVFPADGESAIVPVDGSWSTSTDLGVSIRSKDPAQAPENIAVKVVGQSSEDGVGGGGLVLEVTPTKESAGASEPADGAAASPEPADEPTTPPEASSLAAEPTQSPDEAAQTPEPDSPGDLAGFSAVKPETGFTAPVEVRVDYAKFATAIGGDWASRLKLMLVDDCKPAKGKGNGKKVDCEPAATSLESTNGEAAALESTDGEAAALESRNDTEEQTVSAVVPAETFATGSSTMFAVAAADSGSTGTLAATPLNPASSWSSGEHTGDFAWSFPLATPPSVNGPEPDLAIEYSSGSVDGRMQSKNNQTSWVGEGFSLDPGFIERTYRTCAADNSGTSNAPADSEDLCWVGEYLDISLGGKTSKLIRMGSGPEFRLQQDDGTRIKKLTGTPNGDNDGEYWRVTTPDGTRYYYGRAIRFDGDTQNTKSVSTVPVYGNNDDDPCNGSSFAGSDCKQAWRWSLDYVVDTNGNSMSLFYKQETNWFGSRKNTSVKQYERAQHLTRIEYGTRAGEENNSPAPARVSFELKPRCIDTESFDCVSEGWLAATAEHWPDSPRDRVCTTGVPSEKPSSCSGRIAPTFFTPNRLGSVVTEVREGGEYVPVNQWTLKHSFPDPNDSGQDPALWLDEITPTGEVGGGISLPPVKFNGVLKANRVDKDGDNTAPFKKYRVSSIDNGTGGLTSITYSGEDCSPSDKPSSSSLHSNSRRCFPVWYSSESVETPRLDFFHKYVAEKVTESDGLDGSPDVVTNFKYNGGGAWHFYDDKALNEIYRTWGQWRGFASVSTYVGADEASQVYENTMYLRGMDGDKKQGGGTTSVTRNDSSGDSPDIVDKDYYAGFPRRTRTTLSDSSGEVVDVEVNHPWASAVTASYNDRDARIVDVGTTETKTRLSDGSYRSTKATTTFNQYGQPTQVEDFGDTAVAADNLCTKTSYAQNTTDWILELPAVDTTTAGSCATLPTSAADVIDSTRTSYDGLAPGAAPTKGNVTKSESATGFLAGAITYQTDSTVGNDAYGRVTSEKNALDGTTTTSYEMTDGLTTGIIETNPKNQNTTTDLNKTWGTPNQVTDVAGGKTDYEYDPLGRVTKVWVPGREKSAENSPTHKFDYTVSATAANVVKAEQLQFGNDTYVPTFTFYDGLLRERGTQTPAAGTPKSGTGGGRLITEKIYDSHGRVASERGPTYNSTDPTSNLVTVPEAESEAYTNYAYDRASRVTSESFGSLGAEKWKTTSSYGGDRISVDPPAGGTPTTTVFDVNGQTTKLKQYTGSSPSGDADETDYTYTLAGELKTITNAAGNKWTNTYNIRGNLTSTDDPDRGVTATTYDQLDRPKSTTDAKNQTLWTKYDVLGRKTELRNDDGNGTLRSEWVYDTVKPGLLTSSTRHAGGDEYTSSVESYDTAGRPTATKLTIPTSEGELSRPGGYVETTNYSATGLIDSITPASAPGLPGGELQFDYDLLGNPTQGPGVTNVNYSPYGDVQQRTLGSDPNQVFDTRTYEVGTHRLMTHKVDLAGTTPAEILDQRYGYDDAGNITSLNDVAPGDADESSADTDKQCFSYDYLRRLKDSWSSSTTTCEAPTDTTLGSVAPYWDSYSYDKSGNRTSWVAKSKPGSTVETTTHNYDVPAGTAPRPHATTKDAATGDGAYTESFGYDANGSMTTRSKSENDGQTITWDAEGRQASVTDKATDKKTEYLYDADGNRLIERDETTGSTTLYAGGTEHVLKNGIVTATRTLDLAGEPALTQTAIGDMFVIGDAQSTGLLQIDEGTLEYTKRRFTPFGDTREEGTGWGGGRGFLNKPADPTGTTHLGAREYDPGLGRFLSVDPILDPMDPQQANGYAYASNSPITLADPDGLFAECLSKGCSKKTQKFLLRNQRKHSWLRTHKSTRNMPKYRPKGGAQTYKRAVLKGHRTVSGKLTPPGRAARGTIYKPIPYKYTPNFGSRIHAALDVGGFAPFAGEPLDLLNGLLYLSEGDYGNAAISIGAVVPGIGSFGTGARRLDAARASTKQGWATGDDIYALTKAGNKPAWSTVRGRFWKNEAANSKIDAWSDANVNRMSRGLAPQRYNRDKGGMESMELSHEPIARRDGGAAVVPRWPKEHAAIDPHRHVNY